ncbi:hypothetical protein ABMA28_003853 [Loxostege sticticalis]|uniref:Uncharacterized protein n=1 Tax=Loxostege sticticalis TaxID=481309 RepID=A0ABD0SVM4_LOXSC
MFPNHYYLFDKNKGMPLYFYTQFFQPHILAVPVAYVQGCQVLTTASLQRPNHLVSSSTIHAGPLVHDSQESVTTSRQAVRTALEPIPDDYKFTFTKKLDDRANRHFSRRSPIREAPPKQTPPRQSPPKQAPPLGSTPRRQNRRRLLIITKTKKIDFDLPEEFD